MSKVILPKKQNEEVNFIETDTNIKYLYGRISVQRSNKTT